MADGVSPQGSQSTFDATKIKLSASAVELLIHEASPLVCTEQDKDNALLPIPSIRLLLDTDKIHTTFGKERNERENDIASNVKAPPPKMLMSAYEPVADKAKLVASLPDEIKKFVPVKGDVEIHERTDESLGSPSPGFPNLKHSGIIITRYVVLPKSNQPDTQKPLAIIEKGTQKDQGGKIQYEYTVVITDHNTISAHFQNKKKQSSSFESSIDKDGNLTVKTTDVHNKEETNTYTPEVTNPTPQKAEKKSSNEYDAKRFVAAAENAAKQYGEPSNTDTTVRAATLPRIPGKKTPNLS